MRRLTARLSDERGAVSIIVAVAMVVVLGCAALAIDLARLNLERAELQNGADAAALAVAQSCAANPCTTAAVKAAAVALAATYADANAGDGASGAVTTFPTANSVRVTTSAEDGTTGAGSLATVFAPVFGIDSLEVGQSATSSWGSPAAGEAALALAFAPCVFRLDGAVQVISMHGDSGGTACQTTSPSGQLLPGGFGWLNDPLGTCRAKVDVAKPAPVSGSTGVSLPPGCSTQLAKLGGTTVLLPVYSDKGGTGSSGWYTIKGFAAFQVLGWNFPGMSWNNQTYAGAGCKGTCKGLIGKFVRFVSLDDAFTYGGADLGASIITLSD
ncbi:hypothetical protein ASF48_09870 [Rathayibacter sp. Leaf299]|uniref:pilus assembly protein TadG-related protein n=1 Tax=unclassified Rathayibacter TaxID=2609250 RepID=UPI0006F7B228|nr:MULTISPECIES: pilus assembly protein TadG-related protein [unclassified Rathayibacter]KQQ20869.1 hypothetical protein ASF48_09870 [Rathayibacter sp. Leaf299]